MLDNLKFINEIVEDHESRMKFIKKYYPYFKIVGNGTKLFRNEKFQTLDMGFIVMSTLRYFIEENNFNNQGVSYKGLLEFLSTLVSVRFHLFLKEEDNLILAEEVFNLLTNNGEPFEYNFFDPISESPMITRVSLIRPDIDPITGKLNYYITESGIEFYLETKEVNEINQFSIQQILLEKLLESRNFKGARQVVQRITNQVGKLLLKKVEILNTIAFNPIEGDRLYSEFYRDSMGWFDEEEDYFQSNIALVHSAREKSTLSDSSETKSEINALNNELKRASEMYGSLLRQVLDLKNKVDDSREQRKINVLKMSFDYRHAVEKIISTDNSERLGMFMKPFLNVNTHKFLDFERIDLLLNLRQNEEEDLEYIQNQEEKEYIFDDIIEAERISENHLSYIACLFKYLRIKDQFTLEEFNQYLCKVFTDRVFLNGDYYSFLISLSAKNSYIIDESIKNKAVAFDEMISLFVQKTKDETIPDFEITYLPNETIELKSGFTTTNFMFRRSEAVYE